MRPRDGSPVGLSRDFFPELWPGASTRA
ncbi:unnamed protein product, partial [Didymodactylos carnosus]